MDNNKDNDLHENISEENIEKETTQEASQAPAEEKKDAKSFWKESPYDEMQHVKPDSFAGLSSEPSDGKEDKNKKTTPDRDPDSYWRPRGSSGPGRDGGSQGPGQGPAPSGNSPFRSRRNRIGLIIFAALIILFALTLF